MQKVSVFISYSHDSEEHRDEVLGLSERLRRDGIETILDQYVNGTPTEGWPRWMLNQLDAADSVLVVCTETYYRRFRGLELPGKGKGADWEGALITQEIYDTRSSNPKFIPVFLSTANDQAIPEPMRSATHYALTSDDAYDRLYDSLLGQAGVQAGVVGELKRKPRASGQPLNFANVTSMPGAAMSFPAAAVQKLCSVDISRIDKYAPAELIGREAETQLLSDAWDKSVRGEANRPRVLTFVALGGEGKTSLVAKWAADLANQDWPGCDAVFAWSFYSQGTRDQTAASSDLFLADALTFFGDPAMAKTSQSAFDKGRRLAQLIGERRVLLILDGVEPLQYSPNSPTPGELKDQGLSALLKGLAANNHGLCVVTTRYSIPDLRAYLQTTAPMHELKRLSTDAGVDLLQKLGVKNGSRKEFEALVEDVKGHALTLNLIGGFLKRAFKGDIRQRDRVKFEKADDKIQGGHAFRTMAAYEQWLLTGDDEGRREVAILRLMGLFDRPADSRCLQALRNESIPDLTEPLFLLEDDDWEFSLTGLEEAKLLTVNRDDTGTLRSLDAHPLLREYFAKQLGTRHPEAWRAAHRRVFEHLCATTKEGDHPTLEDLQPLYQAVAHGCQAGIQQEACDRVYRDRIKRGDEYYSTRKLGAFGADLGAVACFFEQPWSRLSPSLTEPAQDWLLNEAAFRLHALGRLPEALEPMRATMKINAGKSEWKNAAMCANNLSELELTLGEVAGAVRDAEQSVTYADRSGDAFQRYSKRATHADALHQAGRRAVAQARFREAEEMQAEDLPEYPLLYSIMGFRYCDLLLAAPERAAWQCILGRAALQPAVSGIVPETHHRAVTDKTPSFHEDATSSAAQDARRSGQDARAPQIQTCRAISQRAAQTLQWAQAYAGASLLDIALNHLTLARAALYEAILEDSSLDSCRASLKHAVDGLRRAGHSDYLPRALLTRAWLRNLSGVRTGAESAQSDLDEAWEIAERGPMPLLLADIHLHRARLFGHRAQGAIGAPYPWESPNADLDAARKLIEKHGYWGRKEELEDAEAAAKTW
jgi:tetratricopeptide (TPR) repeat protein